MGRRCIYSDARCGHLSAIANRGLARARVDTSRVSHAAVMQYLVAARSPALNTVFDIERQNRRQLLHRQREVAPYSADIGDQTARARGHADSRQAGDFFNRFPDDGRIQTPLRSSNYLRELIGFRLAKKISTLQFEL